MFKFMISSPCAYNGKVLAWLGDSPKMQGWTQLPPGPRPLILGMPPPWGLYSTLNGVEHTIQSLR